MPEGRDSATELQRLVDLSGATVTFDSERSIAKPCFHCGTTERPRRLVVVGVWSRSVGNRGGPGTQILRPMCEPCDRATASDLPPQGRTG
jgi:hypothetical protein